MPTKLRSEERFAVEVVRRTLRMTVTSVDDNSLPGQVDATFRLPDGTPGALEVTTLGDRAVMEAERLAHEADWRGSGLKWSWWVAVSGAIRVDALKRHLPALLRHCEALHLRSPELLTPPHPHLLGPVAEAYRWWEQHEEVEAHGFPETHNLGRVDVVPAGDGGAVDDHLSGLSGWLNEQWATSLLSRKVAKLAAIGLPEQHLFLRIHETALPWPLLDGVSFSNVIPPPGLEPPATLTGLWLAARWRNPILWWSKTHGWQRTDCLEAAPTGASGISP